MSCGSVFAALQGGFITPDQLAALLGQAKDGTLGAHGGAGGLGSQSTSSAGRLFRFVLEAIQCDF